MPSSVKSNEYIQNNYSAINAHVDSLVDNERQLSRLKRFRADRVWIINLGIALLFLGGAAVLLAIAYSKYKAPVIRVVDKPVFIDKPVYNTIKVPDPKLSKVIEKIVYITKIVKVPVQIVKREGVAQGFTFFNTKVINSDGIDSVVVGAGYKSVNSQYPEMQWCYANSLKTIGEGSAIARLNLGFKKGLGAVRYENLTTDDADTFGSTKKALNNAKKECEFFPTIPPVENKGEPRNIPTQKPFPSGPSTFSSKSGTGFYVNKDGYIVTNNHVITGCSSVWIEGKTENTPGVVVARNKSLDIAIIKSDKNDSTFATFADSIRTGEDVMALGFPLGKKLGGDIKATKGNISALSGLDGHKDYLQFTAPIQAGNSGGPLLNESGFVVGINTAKLVGEDFQNINFAINGHSAQRFLGENGVDFKYSASNKPMKPADLVEKGEKFTARILCSN